MGSYRVTISATYLGQSVQNTLGYDTGAVTAPTPTEATAVATAFGLAWDEHVLPLLADEYVLQGVDAVSVFAPEIGGFFAVSGAGSKPGTPAPAFVTARVRLTTGLRGRAFQGRMGLSGLTEGDLAGNELEPATVTAIQGAIVGIIGDLGALYPAGSLVVISTIVDGEPRPLPLATPVTGFSVSGLLGSQVSRKA